MITVNSLIFKDMWEVRTDSGWLLGIGDSKEEAEQDASSYNSNIPIEEWESYNMKLKLPTWELK